MTFLGGKGSNPKLPKLIFGSQTFFQAYKTYNYAYIYTKFPLISKEVKNRKSFVSPSLTLCYLAYELKCNRKVSFENPGMNNSISWVMEFLAEGSKISEIFV